MLAQSESSNVALAEAVSFDSRAFAATEQPMRGLSSPEFEAKEVENILGFEIASELGRGAFSRVYLAKQPALAGRLVALKVAKEIAGEIETLGQLRHTNVVPIYSRHESADFQAICMPYLGEVTLQHVLCEMSKRSVWPTAGVDLVDTWRKRQSTARNRLDSTAKNTDARIPKVASAETAKRPRVERLPATFERLASKSYVSAVLEVVAALADGLAHAHDRGILHRDLKPSNVLLTDEGEPMLMDFNLAEDVKRPTSGGPVLGGTLPYASGEQIDEFLGRSAQVDARSDLFSLGVILYEMLTGKLPFEPQPGPNAWDAARKQRDVAPAPIDRLNPAASRRLATVVEKCLAARPAARYQSARELREDLLCCLNDRPLVHALDPAPVERLKRWAERHNGRLGVAAVVTTAAAVLMVANAIVTQTAQRDAAATWNAVKPVLRPLQMRMAAQVALRQDFPAARTALLRAFDPYDIPNNPDWYASSRVRWLPEAERLKFRDQAVMALLTTTQAGLIEARVADGAERDARLADAKRWIERAASAYRGQPLPKAVLLLQAELAALERSPEAEALAALAAGDPIDDSDRLLTGLTLALGRQFGPALETLAAVQAGGERHYQRVFLMGLCHRIGRNYGEALRLWQKCSEADPQNVDLHRCIGMLFAQSDESGAVSRATALDHLAAAAKLDPRNLEVAIAHARVFQTLGETQQAIAEILRALDWTDSKVHVYWSAACLAKDLDLPEQQQEHERQAAQESPATALDWLARSRLAENARPAEALTAAENAWKGQPWRSAVALQYAKMLAKTPGREDDARRVLDKLEELLPGDEKLRRARQKLSAAN